MAHGWLVSGESSLASSARGRPASCIRRVPVKPYRRQATTPLLDHPTYRQYHPLAFDMSFQPTGDGAAARMAMPDVSAFVISVNSDARFSEAGGDVFVGRAPGRLDVMGGIADYSGSLVLQMPIAEACLVALQRNGSGEFSVQSDTTAVPSFVMKVAELQQCCRGADPAERYRQTHDKFKGVEGGDWAAYVLGCYAVLSIECGASAVWEGGASVTVHSDVPISMGVSSSASVEVSTMQAVAAAYSVDIDQFEAGSPYSRGTKLAMLCQKVENRVVGAPCGIMDQMASNLGEEGQLLALLCRPAEVRVSVPHGAAGWSCAPPSTRPSHWLVE
jgi:galactokinase